MTDELTNHLDLVIDCLTNSIRDVESGESFETEILPVTEQDIKLATIKNKWHFSWRREFRDKDRKVFKLVKLQQPDVVQGLISLSDEDGYVYIHLAESAPINFGPGKIHEGVGGNLFAYACKRSWDNGNDGFTSFQAKTRLISHYEEELGAVQNGGQNMIIYPTEALYLIKKYFKV